MRLKVKVYEAIYGLFAKTIFYDWYWKLYHWWYRKEEEQDHQDMISELCEENDSFIAEDGKEYSYSRVGYNYDRPNKKTTEKE